MSDNTAAHLAVRGTTGSGDLLGQTLRTVAALVGACVLFVGALSAAAVFVASKATSAPEGATESHEISPSAPKKPAVSRPNGAASALPI